MISSLKESLRKALAKTVSMLPPGILVGDEFFDLYQEAGIHVRPVHYYEPLPDTRELSSAHFQRRSLPAGVDMRESAQLELLSRTLSPYLAESELARARHPEPFTHFGPVDSDLLYSLVRHLKPERVMEIGSGYSTIVAGAALRRNREEGRPGSITAIEPYPRREVLQQCAELAQLREVQVQAVPLADFEALGENDILFIDSSHVSYAGSDVNYEIHEILPSLAKGVYVHIHDQFFPGDYPEGFVLKKRRFWNEQYMVQAFLAFNHAFEVVASSSFLHLCHSEFLAQRIPAYARLTDHWASSLWLRRVA